MTRVVQPIGARLGCCISVHD